MLRELCLVGLILMIGCSQARWSTEGNGRRAVPTPCLMAQGSDMIARGEITSAGAAQVVTFSLWPRDPVRVTPVTVQIERDLRNRLAPGRYSMLVSAPMTTSVELGSWEPTPVGTGVVGWLYAGEVDGQWLLSPRGLVRSPTASPFTTSLGTYGTEAEFERAQLEAIRDCPRVDYFMLDAGARSTQWEQDAGTDGGSR